MTVCACGRPLHYTDPQLERDVKRLVAKLGANIKITVEGHGTWLVPRHYRVTIGAALD